MQKNAAELPTIVDYAVLDTQLCRHREALPAPGCFTEHYSLRGEVGAGGVGRVLLGIDERIGREVVIKEMHAHPEAMDERLQARFVLEAKITGRLEHPGIVPVYDLGTTSKGSPFYVMRLVRGDTLSKALAACTAKRPEAALAERLRLLGRFIDICEAMAYAHSRGVVHRDLKPGNIVLGGFGETIVLDWGLAKIAAEGDTMAAASPGIADAASADLTRQGTILSTPAYMAPEQLDTSFGDIDPSTDVFALGCILYHILIGHAPLAGNTYTILAWLGSPEPMPSARAAAVPVPPELVAICDKAMRKEQAGRYRDAGELAAELRAYRDGRLVSTYAYSRAKLLRRSVARNKAAAIAALFAIAAILAGAGLAVEFGYEAHTARATAQETERTAQAARERADTALHNITRIADQNLFCVPGPSPKHSARHWLIAPPAPHCRRGSSRSSIERINTSARVPSGSSMVTGSSCTAPIPHSAEIGRNFYRDERYMAIPTLRRLAQEVRDQDAGIGFFKYPATNGAASYHIAAWQAAGIENQSPWKIAVVEVWK